MGFVGHKVPVPITQSFGYNNEAAKGNTKSNECTVLKKLYRQQQQQQKQVVGHSWSPLN